MPLHSGPADEALLAESAKLKLLGMLAGRTQLNGELADWRDGESGGRPDPPQPRSSTSASVVTDRWAGVGPTVAELEAVLLEAKLSVPHRRPGSVSRADLIETARARDCRVVGITAPAGYGKSTLLAEWAETDHRRVAWVSLDRLDDDPSALLSLLASAYARISGYTDLVADMRGLGLSALGHAAPRLASALRTAPAPFVLMLDDLHELRSPACHDVFSVVISGIPHGSQLVAASRFEQPHLPRLRASGDTVEIAAGDLALDAAAAEQIFAEAHVKITHELAAAVTARTEGWPVGLYLAALIARDSRGDVLTISGDDRYVADYLYRESLMQLPESVQRFLRRTAVLDQLCAPLCDAILDESGASAQLRDLEATSLFLVPLDRRRGWYRYHALFREFLLDELQRVEPDLVVKLHLRAADWYESNGSPALAVEHLLNTTERDRCVQLVTQLILPIYQSGQLSTVQRWLRPLARARSRSILPSRSWPDGSRCCPARPPPRNGWRPSSTPPRSTRYPSTAARRSTRRGPCSAPSCVRPGPSRCDRCNLRGGRGTAMEPVARRGVVLDCRGATTPRRRGTGDRPLRGNLRSRGRARQRQLSRGEQVRARPAGDGSRSMD